jgi:hypothetical protein
MWLSDHIAKALRVAILKKKLCMQEPFIVDTPVTQWKIYSEFVRDNALNTSFLKQKYGHLAADVADCTRCEFNDMPKTRMNFGEYLDYLENPDDERLLYLKDWNFTKQVDECSQSCWYHPPQFMCEDWLNAYHDDKLETHQDYRFLYLGPDKSWTPLHADVYRSYSWSVNLLGMKEWILFPPEEEFALVDTLGNLVRDVRNYDVSLYPHISKARYVKLVQKAGETIFVPSNWHHQVHNHGLTLSINHNWLNGFNINIIVEEFMKEYRVVQRSIEDIECPPEEYTRICEDLMNKHYGMNIKSLLDMMQWAESRIVDTWITGKDGIGIGTVDCEMQKEQLKLAVQHLQTFIDSQNAITPNRANPAVKTIPNKAHTKAHP